MNGMEVLEIKKEESKDNQKDLELASNGYKYTKEDICSICNVGHAAFERFAPSSVGERDFISVGSSHKKLYTEQVLQKFQAWLMKNQANQGRASDTIKQATMDNLQVGLSLQEIIKSGNVEAIDEYISIVRNATIAEHNYKLEQAKNQQLVHALEYDEVKDWKKWSDLKKELAQYFEMLRHKINYTKLFDEVGLVENEDYKKKVMGFDKFPTVLVSPEAEDMLWDWLDGHN